MTNEESIIEENMGQFNTEILELEETEERGENGQATEEVSTEEEQGNDETLEEGQESVSQGDAILIESAYTEEILEELRIIDGRLEAMETSRTEASVGIFEKELSNYTTTEGLLLVLVLFVVAFAFMKTAGSIIRCEKE